MAPLLAVEADAAVARCPDPAAGEVPKAFIVRRAPVTQAALMAWVAERVAPYKRIRCVEFTDAIPKSPTGKILRRVLLERDSARLGPPPAGRRPGNRPRPRR